MAGIDTQKQLLSLIRDFTSERSRGEQRVVGLKKRIEVLQSEVEASNSEVEHAKRIKEVAEEELNGYEVELSLNDTTIQSLEARIGLLQDEVSTIGSEIDALKNKEGLLRDQFISQMEELNKEIREFQRTVESSLSNDDSTGVTATFEDGHGADSKAIKNMLSDVNSQLAKEEDGYLAEQKIQQQLQKELDEYEKKMSLMESIIEKTNSVQVLAEQISELEQILASLGEELQKRCRCQQCQAENLEVLSVLLQGDQDMEVS
ncbi:PREDICTED: myosin-1B-like isoform X4 [Camelina sativa]|uniref:Myosin-1B-like isoform X4 n=1 Tax=Camelina sativa TaxID=90675 RepID=A0ABM0YLI1_CAMSA|nr:PREDICTED: myosin-1B-like isoform X4 [Camelina sativa]